MRYRQPPASADKYISQQTERIAKLERLPRATTTSVDSANFVIRDGCLQVFDSAGHLIVEIGKTSDGRYGLRVNDTTGAPQVRAGQLASPQYGVEAPNGSGVLTQITVP
jgi:hypothetical protein